MNRARYKGDAQTYGWVPAGGLGDVIGTTGKSRRLEALQVSLTGDMAKTYDVYYRVHVQELGWMAWARNGASAGTTGQARRAEAAQVVIVPKGSKPPPPPTTG